MSRRRPDDIGAVRLEELWNELIAADRLPLLCAYRVNKVDHPTGRASALRRVNAATTPSVSAHRSR